MSSFQPGSVQPSLATAITSDSLTNNLKGKPLVVARLLTENSWEKAALAELYERHVIRASQTPSNVAWSSVWHGGGSERIGVFIESGSTCACVSEVLRRLAASQGDRLRDFALNTNNHLTAWIFLNQGSHVKPALNESPSGLIPYLFAGRLECKYHGIFPFYHARSDYHVAEERDGYAQLRLALVRSNLMLLTASRLSLRYGPVVGSRENAIFKNACYNACVPQIGQKSGKEIHLFVTIQKLVAHSQPNQESVLSDRKQVETPGTFADFHTWKEELDKINDGKCYPAFSMLVGDEAGAPQGSRLVPSPFATDLVPENGQRLRDGTHAVEMGQGRFRVCNSWQDLFTKAGLTVKVFVAFQGKLHDSDPLYRWIRFEVEDAQTALKQAGINFKVTPVGSLPPRGTDEEFSLAGIEISSR